MSELYLLERKLHNCYVSYQEIYEDLSKYIIHSVIRGFMKTFLAIFVTTENQIKKYRKALEKVLFQTGFFLSRYTICYNCIAFFFAKTKKFSV